jgi:hypothetical protein
MHILLHTVTHLQMIYNTQCNANTMQIVVIPYCQRNNDKQERFTHTQYRSSYCTPNYIVHVSEQPGEKNNKVSISVNKAGMIVHAYNLSYMGGCR